MNNIEIEIQLEVENIKPLKVFLTKNAKKTGELHQIDRYFTPAHKNYIEPRPINEWLRLRDSNGKHLITYKNYHRNAKHSLYCDEYETSIGEIKQIELIFEALGMKEIVVVDKNRTTYIYKDFEVAIDLVKNVGSYVEIEHKGDGTKENSLKIKQEMIDFLKKVGVGKIHKNDVGYPFLIMFPEEVIWREM